ncbi:MAG: hypothetical protein BWY71_02097 [Planctomycetes bacterium ADurb.Bin412]|nr:MAG: hypothetical protein BWY71_02097 [Planctomycetes bacterium ADurb.Bin412]
MEKGFVAGGTLETKRKYGNYYLPYNAPLEGGNYWDQNNAWTSDVKSAFDTYLGDKYKDQKNTWYDTYQKEAGGDIGKVGWTSPASGKEWINTKNPHWQKDVQLGYRQDLQDWWNSLESATGNAEVQKALSGITDYNDFNTWWEGSKYADPKNSIVMRGGQIDFNDPYLVDMGNLNTALADYQSSKTPAASYDYSGILGQLKPEQYEAFNKYVQTYQNGALGDAGIKYNPQTGQSEMYAADGYQMGMRNAVRDFMANEKKVSDALAGLNGTGAATGTAANQGITFTGEDLVPDSSGNLVPNPAKYEQVNGTWQEKTSMANSLSGDEDIDNTISLLNEALASYFKPFDTAKADETFTKSVYDPTMREFEGKTRPSIRESFAGGDLFSSARQQAEDTAKMDLEKQLASDRSTYVANQEENYKNRALSAMGVGMSLAQLPTTLAGAKADVEYKKAAAASMFADIETQNALVNSKLNNDELLAITTLMSLFGTEQQQQQAEWNAAFQNALNADNLDFATIIQLIMGYQDQSQVAVVS